MTKWRCKSNDVVIELHDRETKQMLLHEGYDLVEEENDPPANNKPSPKKTKGKRSNRSK